MIINVGGSGYGRSWFAACLKDRNLAFASREENQNKMSTRNKE
jgi:hypothetical protein